MPCALKPTERTSGKKNPREKLAYRLVVLLSLYRPPSEAAVSVVETSPSRKVPLPTTALVSAADSLVPPWLMPVTVAVRSRRSEASMRSTRTPASKAQSLASIWSARYSAVRLAVCLFCV